MSDMKNSAGRYRWQRGRADPFGLLVVGVMLAVSLTILVQAQASLPERPGTDMPAWFGSLVLRD
jgi:hypothetical protein